MAKSLGLKGLFLKCKKNLERNSNCYRFIEGCGVRALEISHKTWRYYCKLRSGEITISPADDIRLCVLAGGIALAAMPLWACYLLISMSGRTV